MPVRDHHHRHRGALQHREGLGRAGPFDGEDQVRTDGKHAFRGEGARIADIGPGAGGGGIGAGLVDGDHPVAEPEGEQDFGDGPADGHDATRLHRRSRFGTGSTSSEWREN